MSRWVDVSALERNYSDRKLLVRYLKRLRPFKKQLVLLSFLLVLATIVSIAGPIVIAFGVDELNTENPAMHLVIGAGLLFFLLYVFSWGLDYLQQVIIGKYDPFYMENLRMDIFDKLQQQDMSFYDKHQRGELSTRVTNDVSAFGNINLLLVNTSTNVLISICVFSILVWLNVQLALIIFVGCLCILLLMYSFRRMVRYLSKAYRKATGDINTAIVESIEGIQVAKNFGQESTVSQQFFEKSETYFKAAFWAIYTSIMIWPFFSVIMDLTIIAVLFIGGYIFQDTISSGTVFMVILYLQRLFLPVMTLGTFYAQFQAGMAAYERILTILDAEPIIKQTTEGIDVGELKGEIVFEDVDFRYDTGDWVFQGLNLRIKNGERVAIVGHTGAGKTSLISLLARYYEFQGGSIKIDGIDIRDLRLSSYRKNLGIVHQEVFLFNRTVFENVRYGRKEASEEAVLAAIQAVHAEELIEYLPNGLETQVGERGNKLSTGQRQLISFARALVKDPTILVLDEATASVDAYTEALIQEALDILLSGRTAIVIAHRLSTVVNADRIIVMDHGKIIEEGNHKTLLEKGGSYAELYKRYFEHQSLAWYDKQIDRQLRV